MPQPAKLIELPTPNPKRMMKTARAIGYGLAVATLLWVWSWAEWRVRHEGEERLRELARPAEVECQHWYIGWRGE